MAQTEAKERSVMDRETGVRAWYRDMKMREMREVRKLPPEEQEEWMLEHFFIRFELDGEPIDGNELSLSEWMGINAAVMSGFSPGNSRRR